MTQALADAPAQSGNGIQRRQENLPAISPPRLPYHPLIEERFGVDRSSWKALVEAIFPAAQSTESVILALSYCRARKLDPFKRNVHIVPIWDKQRGCLVDTIWPGIGELRTTAFRTGEYAGRDDAKFGADLEQKVGSVDMKFPEWAQVTVYRMVKGQRVAFAGPRVYWLETYATAKRTDDSPNEMWRDRPRGQLEKCSEAAALRAAFPEEVGSDYIPEEVEAATPRGAKQVESNVPERGTAGLMKRLTAKPVSEEQEFEVAPDAVEQVQRQQVDTETGEVTDAEHAAQVTGPASNVPQAGDPHVDAPAPDVSGADAEPPEDTAITEALGQDVEGYRRVLIDAFTRKGVAFGDAKKAVDGWIKLNAPNGDGNAIHPDRRRELFDSIGDGRAYVKDGRILFQAKGV